MADKPSARLSRKHRATLDSLFEKPTRSNVKWSAVVFLLRRLGATVNEKRAGSRVAFALRGRVFVLHKPHPAPELSKGAVEALRGHLTRCGIKP